MLDGILEMKHSLPGRGCNDMANRLKSKNSKQNYESHTCKYVLMQALSKE